MTLVLVLPIDTGIHSNPLPLRQLQTFATKLIEATKMAAATTIADKAEALLVLVLLVLVPVLVPVPVQVVVLVLLVVFEAAAIATADRGTNKK